MDNYKRLNLVQLAKDLYAYKIDTKGSYSQNDNDLGTVYKHYTSLKMYHSVIVGNNESQDDVIFVRKNQDGAYFYTNVMVPGDQGTIIDFIAYRNQLDLKNQEDLGKISTIISSYFGEPIPSGAFLTYVPVKQDLQDRNAQVARYFKLLPEFNHPEYLLARGIEKTILDAGEFKGNIFNSVFKDKKGNQQVNIAFPLVDREDNLRGVEYKNISFGDLKADSDRVIWRSNIVDPVNVEAIVIGKTAIDLISYAQVMRTIAKNYLFISHVGKLSKSQINAIQYLIDQHSPKRVILAEDKDTEGYSYDIMLMGALNRPFKGVAHHENDFKAEINIVDKVNAVLTINVAFADFNVGKVLVDNIIADFTKFNQDPSRPIFKVGADTVTFGHHTASLIIEYHVSESNMRKASEIVDRHRGMSDYITIDKPDGVNLDGNQITDWNEFLMTEKKIHGDDIPGLLYKFKNEKSDEYNPIAFPSFKPHELVQLFIENWDKGIEEVQEAAVDAGVNIDVISYTIAKHQLIAFNNYIEAVERVYDLDFVGFREFENFKRFIAENEDRYKQVVINKKSELNHLENDLVLVKKQLRVEGDELDMNDYQNLMERMVSLESSVKAGKKSLGTHNEYLDVKFYNDLTEIVSAKAKKVWDKTVREASSDYHALEI